MFAITTIPSYSLTVTPKYVRPVAVPLQTAKNGPAAACGRVLFTAPSAVAKVGQPHDK